MNTAEEALKKIEIHEAECKVLRQMIDSRLENIEKRLDSGQARFARIERMIWAIYPLIIGAAGVVELMR